MCLSTCTSGSAMPSFRRPFGGSRKRAPVLPAGADAPAAPAPGQSAPPVHGGPASKNCWSGVQHAEPMTAAIDTSARSSLRAAGTPRLSLAAAFEQAHMEESHAIHATAKPPGANAAAIGRPPVPRDVPPGPPRLSCPWEAQANASSTAGQRRARAAAPPAAARGGSTGPTMGAAPGATAPSERKRPASASSRASPAAAVSAAFAASRASAGRAASAARATFSSLASPRPNAAPRPASASALRTMAVSHEEAQGYQAAPAQEMPDGLPAQGKSHKGSILRRRRSHEESAASETADVHGWTGAAVRRRRPVYKPEEATVIGEAETLTKQLLAAVYEQPLAEQQADMVLSSCPEVEWLVQCAVNSPVPAGWHKSNRHTKDGHVRVFYTNMLTGEESKVPPQLERFARLARLAIHARRSPGEAHCAAAWVKAARDEALRDTQKARDGWSGPHFDKASGAEFYHCPATGASSWTSPSALMAYIATVAEQLLCSEAFAAANLDVQDEMEEEPSPANSEETLEEVTEVLRRRRRPPRPQQRISQYPRHRHQPMTTEQPPAQYRRPHEYQASAYRADEVEEDEEDEEEEDEQGEEEEREYYEEEDSFLQEGATPAVSKHPAARSAQATGQPLLFDLYSDGSEGSEDGYQDQSWDEHHHMEVASVTHVTPSRVENPPGGANGQDAGSAAAALANAAAAMAAAAVALAGIQSEASGSHGSAPPVAALRSAAVALQAAGQVSVGAAMPAEPTPPTPQVSAMAPAPPAEEPIPLFATAGDEDAPSVSRRSVPRLPLHGLAEAGDDTYEEEPPCAAVAPVSTLATIAVNAERPVAAIAEQPVAINAEPPVAVNVERPESVDAERPVAANLERPAAVPRLDMSGIPSSPPAEASSDAQEQPAPEKATALATVAHVSSMVPETDSGVAYLPAGNTGGGNTLRTTSVCSSVVAASEAAAAVASTATFEAADYAVNASGDGFPDQGVEAASTGVGTKAMAAESCSALEARRSVKTKAVGGG